MTTPNFTSGQEAEGKVPALIAWSVSAAVVSTPP
mgnify:CR=1 FL=1